MLDKELLIDVINDRIILFNDMVEESLSDSAKSFNKGGVVALQTLLNTVESGLFDKEE